MSAAHTPDLDGDGVTWRLLGRDGGGNWRMRVYRVDGTEATTVAFGRSRPTPKRCATVARAFAAQRPDIFNRQA